MIKLRLGFTFLEILLTISILLIISTIGVTSYNSYNNKAKVKKAAEELKSLFRLTNAKALNNEKDCNVCGLSGVCGTTSDKKLDGWFVDLASKKIYGQCEGVKFQETSFLSDYTITCTPSCLLVEFYPLGQGTNLTQNINITIANDKLSTKLLLEPNGYIIQE